MEYQICNIESVVDGLEKGWVYRLKKFATTAKKAGRVRSEK
jgi:hypothetical protein